MAGLTTLPVELLDLIYKNISKYSDRIALAKTCKYLNHALGLSKGSGSKMIVTRMKQLDEVAKHELQSISIDIKGKSKLKTMENMKNVLQLTLRNVIECENLPPNLVRLNVEMNYMTIMPNLPSTLTYLDLGGSHRLDSLPTLPPSLLYLNISGIGLVSLPVLPSKLVELRANVNRLVSLPILPLTLLKLRISANRFNNLVDLPLNLVELYASFNNLASLPDLPLKLAKLVVHNNRIGRLPKLPSTLTHLDVSYNNLTSLQEFEYKLDTLNVVGNR